MEICRRPPGQGLYLGSDPLWGLSFETCMHAHNERATSFTLNTPGLCVGLFILRWSTYMCPCVYLSLLVDAQPTSSLQHKPQTSPTTQQQTQLCLVSNEMSNGPKICDPVKHSV